MSTSTERSATGSVTESTAPTPPAHQHVWEVVAVDDNDGPARNRQACGCGEEFPG